MGVGRLSLGEYGANGVVMLKELGGNWSGGLVKTINPSVRLPLRHDFAQCDILTFL